LDVAGQSSWTTTQAAPRRSPEKRLLERSHQRRLVPLKLADAERIASGRYAPVTPTDWSSEFDAHAAGDAAELDILDLPEPMHEHDWTGIALPADAQMHRADSFDYSAWSRELDDLLKQPMLSPSRKRGAPLATTGAAIVTAATRHGAAQSERASTSHDDAHDARPRRRRATWMPLIVLCFSGAAMSGIIGGAAYGLATPEALSWLTGAGDWLGRLQIAVSR
jgi:hypothetical protein